MSTIHYFDADKSRPDSFGSLEKTINVKHLLDHPLHERDTTWIDSFLENIDECNLQFGEPEVAVANDGFAYMNVKTVDPNDNFKAFVIRNELDALLDNGFGLVINSHKNAPDWIFSYGDILNYKLNKEFYTDDSSWAANSKDFVLPQDEKVLVGQPSELIIPLSTRHHIREFLTYSGVKNAKMLLMARNYGDDAQVSQELVFNITPKLFSTHEAYTQVMNTLAWFLPRQYAIAGVDELQVQSGFERI